MNPGANYYNWTELEIDFFLTSKEETKQTY